MPSAIAARPSASSSAPVSAETPPGGEDWRHGGFGIYVHWPFCAAKCPYCDFNSHVRAGIDHGRWRRALVAEVARHAALLPGRRVDSVFFGGGTPSLMEPSTVAAVLDAIADGWSLAPGIEITLEANPTSVEAGRFAGFAAAGVNRVSLGVQALDDHDLRRLGRLHSAAEALAALDVARARFDRVSIDLIYARPDQDEDAWRRELARALALGLGHLSLYQLTIEPGTRFHDLRRRGGLRGLPDPDRAASLYALTMSLCGEAGLRAYEVSNHARAGEESRHNLVYWRYGDYAGIGPGAHGRLTIAGERRATAAIRDPEAWLAAAESGAGHAEEAPLGRGEQAAEMLMMGLRLSEGISIRRHAALAGRPLCTGRLDDLVQAGLIARRGSRIRATDQGRLVLDAVTAHLLG
jgi:putative oxygen-independent coproporphyrinogen III oxidase